MATTYTQEQIDKILEKLPDELFDAIYSVETADNIREVCERQGITDERVGKIAEMTGYVLMGITLPQDFAEALEKKVKLPKDSAKELARDLNRLVFYPVKPALEQLHRMEIEVSAKVVTPKPEVEEEQSTQQGPPKTGGGQDVYQEPIE